jgi:hypothetical protein
VAYEDDPPSVSASVTSWSCCREEVFSATHLPAYPVLANRASDKLGSRKLRKATSQEKGRGVENPGGKVSWAVNRRAVPCPAYSTVTMTPNNKAVKGCGWLPLSLHPVSERAHSRKLTYRSLNVHLR